MVQSKIYVFIISNNFESETFNGAIKNHNNIIIKIEEHFIKTFDKKKKLIVESSRLDASKFKHIEKLQKVLV